MPLPENIKQPLLSEDMKKRKKNMFFMHWRELWLRSRVFYEKRSGSPPSSRNGANFLRSSSSLARYHPTFSSRSPSFASDSSLEFSTTDTFFFSPVM